MSLSISKAISSWFFRFARAIAHVSKRTTLSCAQNNMKSELYTCI